MPTHTYFIHDKLSPGTVRATRLVESLKADEVLDFPGAGADGCDARWKVTRIELNGGSATAYVTDADPIPGSITHDVQFYNEKRVGGQLSATNYRWTISGQLVYGLEVRQPNRHVLLVRLDSGEAIDTGLVAPLSGTARELQTLVEKYAVNLLATAAKWCGGVKTEDVW